MATMNAAVQQMIDRLHAALVAGTASAEDQLLISKALQALQNNATWEQALIAVAEQHLNTGTTALASARALLDTARSTLDSSSTALNAQAANLAQVPVIRSMMKSKDGLIGDWDRTLFQIAEAEIIEDSTYSSLIPIVNSIFCSNGDVYLHAVALNDSSGSSGGFSNNHNFYRALGASPAQAKNIAFTRFEMLYSSNDQSRSNGSQRFALRPAAALLPLAASNGSTTISFNAVISDFSNSNFDAASYRGVHLLSQFPGTARFNTADFVDRYGRRSVSIPSGGPRASTGNETVLYNNVKNCVVVIQNGAVWELYANGWFNPGLPALADNAAVQAWVNSLEDAFIIPLQYATQEQVYSPLFQGHFRGPGRSVSQLISAYENTSANINNRSWPGESLSGSASSAPVGHSCSASGLSNGALSGGAYATYSVAQQYLFDVSSRRLTPTFRESFFEVVPAQLRENGSTTTPNLYVTVKMRSVVRNMATRQVVGECSQLFYTRMGNATDGGVWGVSLPMANPYSGLWYQYQVTRSGSSTIEAGFSRLEPIAETFKLQNGI